MQPPEKGSQGPEVGLGMGAWNPGILFPGPLWRGVYLEAGMEWVGLVPG
jgi:hypothetical protein